MSLNRTLSWSAATRNMRADRTFQAPAANLAERIARNDAREESIRLYRKARIALNLAASQPLANAAGYDRHAIMILANAIVREQMAATLGRTYRNLISAAMKKAWAAAKDARLATAH
jgi:hypothetical protein